MNNDQKQLPQPGEQQPKAKRVTVAGSISPSKHAQRHRKASMNKRKIALRLLNSDELVCLTPQAYLIALAVAIELKERGREFDCKIVKGWEQLEQRAQEIRKELEDERTT